MAEPKTLSAEELAGYLGVSFQRVYLLLSEGKLPSPIPAHGPGFRWEQAQIERWADREWWGTPPVAPRRRMNAWRRAATTSQT